MEKITTIVDKEKQLSTLEEALFLNKTGILKKNNWIDYV
jgi:hypothetical protein